MDKKVWQIERNTPTLATSSKNGTAYNPITFEQSWNGKPPIPKHNFLIVLSFARGWTEFIRFFCF